MQILVSAEKVTEAAKIAIEQLPFSIEEFLKSKKELDNKIDKANKLNEYNSIIDKTYIFKEYNYLFSSDEDAYKYIGDRFAFSYLLPSRDYNILINLLKAKQQVLLSDREFELIGKYL